ncbi:MAG: serine/threonine protein kinase [Phycisphaeraceae bacterium]|nr:MAG: serine/threonine protein kinase [Phycisphaeraceae bacterium]
MDHRTESTTLLEFLFERAMEMPAPERADFLDRECPDGALRDCVESLLKSHDDASGFLDTSDRTSLWPLAEDQAGPSLIGRRLKHYHVTRRIGVGGMGVVYEAEQSSPKRRVALKVLRQGRLSRSASRRIAIEAEALGRLNHPGIAQIIEAGAADLGEGPQPFFAMELVEGDTLLDYVKKHNPSRRDRLKLFVRICEAVHHAHMKGVIHRDLKPGNILVVERRGTGDDGESEPQPKVLDFGVARATDSDIQHTTVHGDSGAIIGTVAYMSPEQIKGEFRQVDARSDVYALGVLLFELLAERLPFDVRSKPIPEAMRMISEDDPTTLASLDHTIPRDLDIITHKAMSRDPARRYDSASALADDVRRFLDHQPINARAPSALYRFGKLIRRHRVLAASIAIIAALLFGAVLAINRERVRAIHAHLEAETQYDEAIRLSNYFLSDVVTRLERVPGALEIRRDLLNEILRQSSAQLKQRPDDVTLLGNHARALEAAVSLLTYDEEQNREAYQAIDSAVRIRSRLTELRPDDPWQRMRYAVAIVMRAQVGARTGDVSDPIPDFLIAHDIDAELADEHPHERRFLDNLFWSKQRIGMHLHHGNAAAAKPWLDDSLGIADLLIERFPDHYLTLFASCQAHYAQALYAWRHAGRDDPNLRPALERAAQYGEQLLLEYPHSRQFTIHMARVLQLKGLEAEHRGDIDAALAHLRASRRLIETISPYEARLTDVRMLLNQLPSQIARVEAARKAPSRPPEPELLHLKPSPPNDN